MIPTIDSRFLILIVIVMDGRRGYGGDVICIYLWRKRERNFYFRQQPYYEINSSASLSLSRLLHFDENFALFTPYMTILMIGFRIMFRLLAPAPSFYYWINLFLFSPHFLLLRFTSTSLQYRLPKSESDLNRINKLGATICLKILLEQLKLRPFYVRTWKIMWIELFFQMWDSL